jgi:CRISPR-associated protein Cas6
LINASRALVTQFELHPCINVSFSLSGPQLPADHGYLVYSAISRSTSSLHGIDWLAIELISGVPAGPGMITLPERGATLCLRIPADHYSDVLPLAGKRLDIGGHQIRLGLPVARPLEPAPSLYARVVTIKKFTEADPFIEAVKRKLDSFGVKGRVELPHDEQGRYRRRIVTIHGKSVVGFSLEVLSKSFGATPIGNHRVFSQLTFRNHIPVAQRLVRPNQNIPIKNVESRRNVMWEGGWDREQQNNS